MNDLKVRIDRIRSGVWVLGFVRLLMDASPEMTHGLLPLVMAAMSVVYLLSADPFGKLSDEDTD